MVVGTKVQKSYNSVKICVVKTPANAEENLVDFRVPYTGTDIQFDGELCNRTQFLPNDYWVSVRVYDGQYLHLTHRCLEGDCNCIYFLDGIPLVLHPCRLAALLFHLHLFSREDLFVLTGLCRGFRIVDQKTDVHYKMGNYKSILTGSMKAQMCT